MDTKGLKARRKVSAVNRDTQVPKWDKISNYQRFQNFPTLGRVAGSLVLIPALA
jgi:hypothetical protein